MNAVKSIKINALQLAAVAVCPLFRPSMHFKYELKSPENASHPNYKKKKNEESFGTTLSNGHFCLHLIKNQPKSKAESHVSWSAGAINHAKTEHKVSE